MLVKDLDGIMFESQKVDVVVFENGDVIDRTNKISWSYAKRIYGDLELNNMFSVLEKLEIILYVSFPEPEKKQSPELQSIMECYEEFFEFVDDCGMRALL